MVSEKYHHQDHGHGYRREPFGRDGDAAQQAERLRSEEVRNLVLIELIDSGLAGDLLAQRVAVLEAADTGRRAIAPPTALPLCL